jgi:hypothetical protein
MRFPAGTKRCGRGKTIVAVVILAVVLVLSVTFAVRRKPGQVSGALVDLSPEVAPGHHRVGEFTVALRMKGSGDASDALLSVAHSSRPHRVLWSSIPGESFVATGRGEETVRQTSGHFSIRDEVEAVHPDQTVDHVERRGDALAIRGRLLGGGEEV